MKKKLTAQRAHELVSYDEEAGTLHWRVDRTGGVKAGDRAGSYNVRGYRRLNLDGETHYEHRVIWLLTHGRWPADQIDHINGKLDDNRLANLREATAAENRHNVGMPNRNTSGYRGVVYNRAARKWQAHIGIKGRLHYLGLYADPKKAAKAYEDAAREVHGEFYREAI